MNSLYVIAGLVILILYLVGTHKFPGLALLVYVPVVLFMIIFGTHLVDTHQEGLGGFYISIGIILLITGPLCVWLWGGDLEKGRWKRKIGRFIFISLMILGGIAISLPVFFNLIGIYFLFFVGFLVASIVSFIKASRVATIGFIIITIGASLRQSLPLPAALRAAKTGQSGSRQRICENIADWLTKGMPLSVAIMNSCPKFPSRILSQITQGEKINQLPAVFESIENDIVKQARDSAKVGPVKPVLYVGLVFFIASAVTIGLSMFVLPKFFEIFDDFSVTLPGVTLAMIDFTKWISKGFGGVLLGLTILALLIGWIVISIISFFSRRNPEKTSFVFRFKDRLRWNTPFVHWFEYNYSALALTELLKNSVDAGVGTVESFENAAGLDVNYCFRQKIKDAAREIEQGGNVCDVIAKHELPKPLGWAYSSASSQSALVDILQMLEDFYRSNYSYAVTLAKYILTPVSIMAIGVFVGFVCYSIFLPMVEIIEVMTDLVP